MTTLRKSITGLLLAIAIAAGPRVARAQLISVKTVPVAAGDQFMIHPSRNVGMGGLSIALDDPLLDPFVNPAKGARLTDARLYGAPTFYSLSGGDGAGRTLPVGALFGASQWFGGLSLSLQQIESPDRTTVVPVFRTDFDGAVLGETLNDRSANNMYAFGMVGRRIPGSQLSVGASITYADLEAVDGVDLLYALSQRIEQTGYLADFRVGVSGDAGNGSTFEALVLHNRFDMEHDVTYVEWLPCEPPGPCDPGPRLRTETNLDRTNTWGVHLGYRRPVGTRGWQVGGLLTTNWKSHPKIPNYEIMNIPRDPGNSWAYNFGVGIARTSGPTVFGVDLIWEPIWSDTWAEADSTIQGNGGPILPGEKTIENDFRFSNARIRIGAGRETERYGLQLGLEVRSYGYTLDQFNNITGARREQDESWMEWSPSWGGTLKFPDLHIRYAGRLTTGTGRPGVAWTGNARAALDLASSFIVAPSAPLTLQDVRVMTHQISVSLPIN
jgi:hypothetical protein